MAVFPQNPVGVCTDMYDGYVNAAREVFGKNTPVIVDRFHVTKLYRQCLVNLRKNELARLRKLLSAETYQSLKTAIAILKRNKGLHNFRPKMFP